MTLQDETMTAPEPEAVEPTHAPSVQVIEAPVSALDDLWPSILPMVRAALDHSGGERDANDIRQMIAEGQGTLWLVVARNKLIGCCVGNIVEWPRKRIATAIIVAGEGFDEWGGELARTLIEWARASGCDALDGWGRDGWPKKLKPFGFQRLYQVVRLEL